MTRPAPTTGTGVVGTFAPLMRRFRWVFVDQALSSASNFLCSIVVLRSVSAMNFGAFTVGFLTYQFLLSVSRAVSSEPLVIRYSSAKPERDTSGPAASTGTALLLGIVSAVILLIVASRVGSPVRAALVSLAVVLPGLLLQDAWRYVFVAAGRPEKAAANDLVWVAAQAGLFVMLVRTDTVSVVSVTLAWGGSATFAAVMGAFQARLAPAPWRVKEWLFEHGRIAIGLTTDYLITGTAAQLALLSVGVVSGLTELGFVRAGLLLFGPLYIVLQGAVTFAVPEAVRLCEKAPGRLVPAARTYAGLLAVASAGWGGTLVLLPDRIGVSLLGDTWRSAQALVPALTVVVVSAAMIVAAAAGLRGLVAMRRIVLSSLLVAPINVVSTAAGAVYAGADGAVLAMALANCLFAVILWWQFSVAVSVYGSSHSRLPS